jgi:hypothetical protein
VLWPTIICIVAGIIFGVPFTYYWLRWSDKNAVGSEKRFVDKPKSKKNGVRVVKVDTDDVAGDGR